MPQHSHSPHHNPQADGMGLRVDKWLWAARFFKTRSLATEAVSKGHVKVGGHSIKPSREVRVGDELTIQNPGGVWTVAVLGLSATRGPAPVAQALYAETEASRLLRQAQQEQQRLAPEPGLQRAGAGRPTKRQRRQLDTQGHQGLDRGDASWNDRWSAEWPTR